MESKLQKKMVDMEAFTMIARLKEMFQEQARIERFATINELLSCKMVAGSSVSPHVLKMRGYLDHLEKIGLSISQELATDIILQTLPDAYDGIVMNYNMHNMEKMISELHGMLKTAERNIKTTNNVLIVKKGKGKDTKRKWVTKGKAKGKDTNIASLIRNNLPPKYKDPRSHTISIVVGNLKLERALVDLGASVNLLPYLMYVKQGLGELEPTNLTLQLADRSVKIPRGMVKDVLVQVDRFYFPVDFVVVDTQPVMSQGSKFLVILGRPFLATANATIHCKGGLMTLSFGNMTVNLNIFNVIKEVGDGEDICKVNVIESFV